jgi:hypothetical protein
MTDSGNLDIDDATGKGICSGCVVEGKYVTEYSKFLVLFRQVKGEEIVDKLANISKGIH